MPKWVVILLILMVVGGLILIKVTLPNTEDEDEDKKPPIWIRSRGAPITPTPTPSPTRTPTPTPPQPSPEEGSGLDYPGKIDCEWRGNKATYHVRINVVGSEGELIIEQDVEWKKNKEYRVEGEKLVNMTWTKEADYTIISGGGNLNFHVSETSDELWKGCEVLEWVHRMYGPWGVKEERGNEKPTPGLSFIGFYNISFESLVRTSEESVKAGDRVYHCWVYETKAMGSDLEITFWFSPEAPVCGLVKATLKGTLPEGYVEMTIELTGSS